MALQAWGCAPQDEGYRFQGRGTALADILRWLNRDRSDRRALVVTGQPGAGKSAVLGRIIATADPGMRARLSADDDAMRAPEGSVACAVHVKGKTAVEVAQEIARAFSAELPPPTGQLDNLAPAVSKAIAEQGHRRLNLVIDALDEASRPADTRLIVTQIVRPLLRAGVQVVVGSRRNDDDGNILLQPEFRHAAVIDLDAATYYSPQDLAAYALSLLQRYPDGPYADQDAARPLAARIAELSRGSFLVAGAIAQRHAGDEEPADPGQLSAGDAEDILYEVLAETLERRSRDPAGMPVTDALTALTALAFAEGSGLPSELWSAAVASLPGAAAPVRLESTQLAQLARSAAGSFVRESTGPDGKAVFGLYHQALNDALLNRRAERTTAESGDPLREDRQALTLGSRSAPASGRDGRRRRRTCCTRWLGTPNALGCLTSCSPTMSTCCTPICSA